MFFSITRKKITILAILFFVFFGLAGFCFAQSDNFGIGTAAKVSGLAANKISTSGDLPTAIGLVISVALGLAGVFFFLLLLYGGFTWMTAAGSSEKVDAGKSRIISAAIGLIIVLSAYTLTSFIFSRFLGGVDTSDAPGTSGEAACFCLTTANCQAAGGTDGASCGEGLVCCQTCGNKGGACFNPNYEDCEGDKARTEKTGCVEDSRGQPRSCCLSGRVIDLTNTNPNQ